MSRLHDLKVTGKLSPSRWKKERIAVNNEMAAKQLIRENASYEIPEEKRRGFNL